MPPAPSPSRTSLLHARAHSGANTAALCPLRVAALGGGHDGGVNGDELDVNGDGVADVVVPGLPSTVAYAAEAGPVARLDAVVTAQMPPSSNAYSPMGQIDHLGYALRSQTARTGWRRPVVRVGATLWLAAMVGTLVIALVAALT